MTFADAKQRFSTRVADYVRYRPGYPSEMIALLRTECGLRPGHVIADIGSGTGFLSELFLKNGNRVYGVEPNEAMRQAGEEYLAAYDGFSSIEGSAESTTLDDASVDFVTAGQAFHWFQQDAARTEFRRILKADGWIVVAWNDRQMDTPFAGAYEDLLVQYGTDYKKVREAYPEAGVMQEFFSGGSVAQRSIPNAQTFDLEGLVGRVRSSSYAPLEGHANYAPMMAAIEELFRSNQQDGRVRMEYSTHVYYGRVGASR
jgi:ubiquinone/menaquinone biosynthesis C-methylase UbiE